MRAGIPVRRVEDINTAGPQHAQHRAEVVLVVVRVDVFDSLGTPVATAVSDEAGQYVITGLASLNTYTAPTIVWDFADLHARLRELGVDW